MAMNDSNKANGTSHETDQTDRRRRPGRGGRCGRGLAQGRSGRRGSHGGDGHVRRQAGTSDDQRPGIRGDQGQGAGDHPQRGRGTHDDRLDHPRRHSSQEGRPAGRAGRQHADGQPDRPGDPRAERRSRVGQRQGELWTSSRARPRATSNMAELDLRFAKQDLEKYNDPKGSTANLLASAQERHHPVRGGIEVRAERDAEMVPDAVPGEVPLRDGEAGG